MSPTSRKKRSILRRPTRSHGLALPLALTLALALGSLVALPAAAQSFQEDLTRADGLLREGRYAEALGISGSLVAEVAPQIVVPGDEGEGALGMLLGVHALAQAGVAGEGLEQGVDRAPALAREATFHWTLAQSLEPALGKSTLAVYGEAGARLAEVRVDESCRLRQPLPEGLEEPRKIGDPGVVPPRKVRSPFPQYSPHARQANIEGAVILRAVVDREGRVRYPCVLDTDSPVFVYMLAEAVKDWRFEPALVDSRPVPVYYDLSIRFTLDR